MTRARQLSSILSGEPLSGFRNNIINGGFDIWQRGNVHTATGYTADRWRLSNGTGSSNQISRGGAPAHASELTNYIIWERIVAGEALSYLETRLESVRTVAGKTVTVTFDTWADDETTLDVGLFQVFGTGGSPSPAVAVPAQTVEVPTKRTRFSLLFDVPNLEDKIIGDNGDDYFILRFIRRHTDDNPTTKVRLARISLVEGDATAEVDPFSPRHIQQELALCQRYTYAIEAINQPYLSFGGGGYCDTSSSALVPVSFPVVMRSEPSLSVSDLSHFMIRLPGNILMEPESIGFSISSRYGGLMGIVSTGLTPGEPVFLNANNNQSARLIFSAEL